MAEDPPIERRAMSGELNRAVHELTISIKELRSELVRKDVYEADQGRVADRLGVTERGIESNRVLVERIEERRAADRRLVITSFALPILLIILQLYLASQTGAGK